MILPPDVVASLANRSAVVTGGTGMIGREVVRLLVEAGAQVTSVSLDRLEVHPDARHVYGDLADFGFCKDVTKGVDFVFHVAGVKGSVVVTKEKPASFFVPLLMMNTNVLEACRVNAVPKVVYTSSIGAYSGAEVFREDDYTPELPPMDMFPGWAKRMAEFQIDAYRIQYGSENFAVVRPSNIYGPGDNFDPENAMVIPTLMARIRRGEDPVVIWGDGSAIRDFLYSEDCAAGIILACVRGTGGRFVNLGSGEDISIRDLVEALHDVTTFRHEFDPSKPAGFPKRVMDIELARDLIGWKPQVSLREGLKRTWDWFLANEDEFMKRQNYFKN